ncbi:MAG: hypothetical protein JSS81_14235 [Acidobacteria bacterium]|nr:hypothetical protein [Acidobacteriota bacterium]
MKKKLFALLALGAIVLGAASVGLADTKVKKKAAAAQLLALLPPSDAVMTVDGNRLFGEALPQILSANQPLLADILGKFDEIKTRTGIDFKQFQQIAIGVNAVKGATESDYRFEPLVLARGQFNAGGLVAVAKIASNGKYREEKIGDRTVYVFSAKEIVEQSRGKIPNTMIAKIVEKVLLGLSDEMAVTAYDANTLALGSLARVREALDTKARVGDDVLSLIARKPNAILNFGARIPPGAAQYLGLDNDELGRNVDAIRFLSGSMDVLDGKTSVWLAARTVNAEQAKGLKDMLDGLQAVGKAVLGNAKSPDKRVYGRMVESAKIAQTGNEVTLDLVVPQADLDVIVGEKK